MVPALPESCSGSACGGKEMAGRAVVLKVNTEINPDLGARFRVQSIPNFVVLRDGKVVLQQPGLVGRDQMKSWLQAAGVATA